LGKSYHGFLLERNAFIGFGKSRLITRESSSSSICAARTMVSQRLRVDSLLLTCFVTEALLFECPNYLPCAETVAEASKQRKAMS
jgi:hypothetical protein